MPNQQPRSFQHSNSLGQILATVLLGIKDAEQALANPGTLVQDIAEFVSEFTQIWFTKGQSAPPPPAPASPAPQPTATPAPVNPSGTTQPPV